MPLPVQSLNAIPNQEPYTKPKFTISAPPKTDIFASPAAGYHFSAPTFYTILPLDSFTSATATIVIPFTLSASQPSLNPTLQFDQGGLVFALSDTSCKVQDLAKTRREGHPRWVKSGIEVWEGKAWGSVVVREKWCDWSLFEPPNALQNGNHSIMLKMERLGDSLMVWVMKEGSRNLVRKVPWVWMEDERHGVEEVMIGVYGARPDPFDEAKGRNLEIGVENFEVLGEELMKVL